MCYRSAVADYRHERHNISHWGLVAYGQYLQGLVMPEVYMAYVVGYVKGIGINGMSCLQMAERLWGVTKNSTNVIATSTKPVNSLLIKQYHFRELQLPDKVFIID